MGLCLSIGKSGQSNTFGWDFLRLLVNKRELNKLKVLTFFLVVQHF